MRIYARIFVMCAWCFWVSLVAVTFDRTLWVEPWMGPAGMWTSILIGIAGTPLVWWSVERLSRGDG